VTYSELVTAIQTYTENNFPTTTLADSTVVTSTTQINRLITQAEQRIYNSVQFPSIRKNQYSAITANNKYVSLPNDFLSVYSLALVTGATGSPINLDTGTFEYLLNKLFNKLFILLYFRLIKMTRKFLSYTRIRRSLITKLIIKYKHFIITLYFFPVSIVRVYSMVACL
jgi:hypothetical protein